MADAGGFWAMGGYAAFVWPAYAVTLLALAGLLFGALRALRQAERALAAQLALEGGGRVRRHAPTASAAGDLA